MRFGTETIYAMFMKDSFGCKGELYLHYSFNGFYWCFQESFLKAHDPIWSENLQPLEGVGNALLARGYG
jgi:hypothetical protein